MRRTGGGCVPQVGLAWVWGSDAGGWGDDVWVAEGVSVQWSGGRESGMWVVRLCRMRLSWSVVEKETERLSGVWDAVCVWKGGGDGSPDVTPSSHPVPDVHRAHAVEHSGSQPNALVQVLL